MKRAANIGNDEENERDRSVSFSINPQMVISLVLLSSLLALNKACSPQQQDEFFADPRDCARTALLRIYTKYPWDEGKIEYYRGEIEKGLRDLEIYGGVTVQQMGTRNSKMFVRFEEDGKSVYGEQHTMNNLKVPCTVIQEFTRKAVSWSNNINKAVLACRCENPYEVHKITPLY